MVLEGLESAKSSFEKALAAVPGEALSFLKPNDDYSLGGLVAHNVGVVEHYTLVLDSVLASGFTTVRPEDPPGFWESVAARSREPLAPDAAPAALAELDRRHAEFVAALRAVPEDDWERKAPVFYGNSQEALPTCAVDIVGWVHDHYLEHVPHIHELHEEWQKAAG